MLPQEASFQVFRDHLIGGSVTGSSNVQYYLRELIGEGGQGWVYKANYDEPDGMWVVVKILRPDSIHQESLVRFEREAEVLRMMGTQATPCPNVVRFYDHGFARFSSENESVELPFTVLEYVDGITLAEVIDASANEGLSVGRVRRLLRQVVRALESVHAHRVVHRDLKPSNILIAMQAGHEIAKVTDFGLVKMVDLALTQTAAIAGATLGYAPPEQYEHGNERVTEKTDVFSLAAILFECVAGTAAFPYKDGENPLRVITRILTGPRPSLVHFDSTLSRELRGQSDLIEKLDKIIARGLQADPALRQGTCRAFWSEAEPLLRTAEGRAVELGLLPAGVDGSLPGVSVEEVHLRVRPPLAGSDATTMAGPSANVKRQPPAVQGWRLGVLSGPLRGVLVRDALFGADGSILALGPGGLLRWSDRTWSALPSPVGLDPSWVRGMLRTPDSKVLLFGDDGQVVTLQPDGSILVWSTPKPGIRILDAWLDRPDEAFFVGERPNGSGFILHLSQGRESDAQFIETPSALRGIARSAGGVLLACGDSGALLRLQLPVYQSVAWGRTGHLHAMVPKPAGGFAIVGSGGHALHVSPSLDVLLEPVQTTRDLHKVAVGQNTCLWAAGSDGRILWHDGKTWVRVNPSTNIPSRLIGLGAIPTGVLALGEDGTVVEALWQ